MIATSALGIFFLDRGLEREREREREREGERDSNGWF
jgi:hypothetical protein